MSTVEGYIPVNGSAGNSAPVGGRRHQMRKVSAKTIRKHLHKHGLKPKSKMVLKGGVDPVPEAAVESADTPAAKGGKRGKKGTKKHSRRHRSTSFHASLGRMMGL